MGKDLRVRWRGESLPLAGWASRAGVNETTLRARLGRGMALEVALTAPRLSASASGRMGRRASTWR